MGVVYLGISWDGAPVAVKVLRRDLAGDQEFRHRFGREVAALVRVKGVCTVRVIEADSQSSTPFVVTEYAPAPRCPSTSTSTDRSIPRCCSAWPPGWLRR